MTTTARIGRPSKLTKERAARLVELVATGATTAAAAARALNVDPSTVANWRARAWSREPRDAPFVELERRLIRAERQGLPSWEAAVEAASEPDWRAIAARLSASNPAAWGPSEGP